MYFSEVGAEGELRAVSTEIDEICSRRDTLMHFLRKQCHAESSNRLVAFSREVLRYWATLDPAGLEPYLSADTMAAVRDETEWAAGPHRVGRAACGGRRRDDRGVATLARPGSGPGTSRRVRHSMGADESSDTAVRATAVELEAEACRAGRRCRGRGVSPATAAASLS